MNEHDQYMAEFMKVFETLERWGPGSDQDTQMALAHLPTSPDDILEIGCGRGLATLVLAKSTTANITALDDEQSALDQLAKHFDARGLSSRLQTVCASMTELPFTAESFDLIWAEGSAYIMGVENALIEWKPILRKQGYLVISDMVWRTETPSEPSISLWKQEYPDIQSVEARIRQIEKAGYKLIAHFPQSEQAWKNYYAPLKRRIDELESDMSTSKAFSNIKHETEVCTHYSNEFGYHMFVLAK